jgi:YVTN family beta-propeller protein
MCDDHMLQDRLAILGYLEPGSSEWQEGTFSTETEAAVREFEKANGLMEDGTVDWQEWRALFHPSAVPAGGSLAPTVEPSQPPTAFQVGENPIALAFDGQRVWVAHSGGPFGSTVLAIDPAMGTVSAPIRLGACPPDYDMPGNAIDDMIFAVGKLWVVMPESSSYQAVDLATGYTQEPIPFADYPTNYDKLAFDGNLLWVGSFNDITLRALDPANGSIIYEIYLYGGPGDMTFRDNKLLALNGDCCVESIDPATGEYLGELMVGGNAILSDGKYVWLANIYLNAVLRLDPAVYDESDPSKVEAGMMVISVGNGPSALAFDGKQVWVANADDNTVQPIDAATGQAGDPIPVGNRPIALLFDGSWLWVANSGDGTVQFITP